MFHAPVRSATTRSGMPRPDRHAPACGQAGGLAPPAPFRRGGALGHGQTDPRPGRTPIQD